MNNYNRIAFAVLLVFCCSSIQAQESDSDKGKVDLSFTLQNMFYWRGAPLSVFSTPEQTPAPLMIAEMTYAKKGFTAGFWTGQSFISSGYKNASYYVKYDWGNFNVSLWDVYTYSGVAPNRSRDFFNFKNAETQHFIDLDFGYKLKKIPLSFFLATIIYGRDGSFVDEDYQNRYSTYFKVDYLLKVNESVGVDFFSSYGLVLSNVDGINFYGTFDSTQSHGFTEFGVTGSKKFQITPTYSIDLSVGAIASPLSKRFDGLIAIKLL